MAEPDRAWPRSSHSYAGLSARAHHEAYRRDLAARALTRRAWVRMQRREVRRMTRRALGSLKTFLCAWG